MAGVREAQALDLVRDDGRPCLRLFLCFTCPAITVATVILWALDRVRGRALGWLGPGSPKSQPHQALRGVAKLATGLTTALLASCEDRQKKVREAKES